MEVKRFRIESHSGELFALLGATPTSAALCAAIPIESAANTEGKEIYFSVSVVVKLEAEPRQVVEPGAVCFGSQEIHRLCRLRRRRFPTAMNALW